MSYTPTLCILGAGSNIGGSIARLFGSKGYRVALVSRTKPKQDFTKDQVHVQRDLSDPEAVASAFDEVKKALGVPSVVVYNAAAHSGGDKANPAAVSRAALAKDLNINTLSVISAAEEAVKGFRELPSDASKAFIYTGNRLNIEPIPGLLSLGIGKTATAHFIATASSAYKADGIGFYYADERTADGAPVYNAIDGDAHAKMYWQLANRETDAPWLATFVKGVGYKDFS